MRKKIDRVGIMQLGLAGLMLAHLILLAFAVIGNAGNFELWGVVALIHTIFIVINVLAALRVFPLKKNGFISKIVKFICTALTFSATWFLCYLGDGIAHGQIYDKHILLLIHLSFAVMLTLAFALFLAEILLSDMQKNKNKLKSNCHIVVKKLAMFLLLIGALIIMSLGLFWGYVFGWFAGPPKPINIVCNALFTNNFIELPILGVQPNAPGYYNIDMSIDEMFAIINADESLSAKLVDDNIFISKDNNDGTKDYFLIGEHPYRYTFSNMGGRLAQLMLIPYHLIEKKNHVGRE